MGPFKINLNSTNAMLQLEILKSKTTSAEEKAKAIAALAEGVENRLPKIAAEQSAKFERNLTRISTDTPDSWDYDVFCNGKELDGVIFADVNGQIAVCYQVQNNRFVRREDYSIKTVVHHGNIEIRKNETGATLICPNCEETRKMFAVCGKEMPEDFVCPFCNRRGGKS